MTESAVTRAEALRDVVALRRPLADAVRSLQTFGWDSADELVTLRRVDATSIIGHYLNGELVAENLQQWAEVLEGREDLGFETPHEDLLKEFLFEIATPEVSEPLSLELARRWQAKLMAPPTDGQGLGD